MRYTQVKPLPAYDCVNAALGRVLQQVVERVIVHEIRLYAKAEVRRRIEIDVPSNPEESGPALLLGRGASCCTIAVAMGSAGSGIAV